MRVTPRTTARLFHAVAAFEAFTWVGLLVGMAFKYLFTQNEIGVQVFGPLHGAAFVAYLLVTLLASVRLRWGAWATLVTLVASVPPLTTLVADWWLHRTGRLTPATEREPEPIA